MTEPFVHRLRVRYHECDAQGIVFNANWFTYFDVTLTEWSGRRSGPTARWSRSTGPTSCWRRPPRFRGSARFDEDLEIAVADESLGRTSMVVGFVARREGEALVEGRTVYVFVDPASMGKREIPAAVRSRLEGYVAGTSTAAG